MTDQRAPQQGESLVQRLRHKYGPEFKAEVSLPNPLESPNPSSSTKTQSSGVLSRLGNRSPLSTRYRFQSEIGRGGMGAILEVWDEDLRRSLAMKVALGKAGEGSKATKDELDPRILARFLEEAQVTGQLEHPGIVPVHELGLDENGQVYFTMRLVHGRDLEDIFKLVADGKEDWTTTRALGVLLKVCETMEYAHTRGVVHRDLKPANIMVGNFGEVYVMDWGLVHVKGHEEKHDLRIADSEGMPAKIGSNLVLDRREDSRGASGVELYTMDGDVIGTPAYMAPEQARGDLSALDGRADIYSLGAMLYRLLSGSMPYTTPEESRSPTEILVQLLNKSPKPLAELNPGLPEELVAICEKAMSRDPAQRYEHMGRFAHDLRAYLEHRVVAAYETGAVAEARKWVRRNRPLAASLAAAILALVAGLVGSIVLKREADNNAQVAEEQRALAVDAALVASQAKRQADDNAALANQRQEQALASAQLAEESAAEAKAAAERAEASKREAIASAEEAKRQESIAREVNAFLNDDLLSAVAPEHYGMDVTVREIVNLASVRMRLQMTMDPLVKAEIYQTLGNVFISLGEFDQANFHLEQSLAIRKKQIGDRHGDTVASQVRLASLRHQQNRIGEAKDLYESALAILREDFDSKHPGVAACLGDLALIYSDEGKFELADAYYRELLEAEDGGHGPEHHSTLINLNNYGNLLMNQGLLKEAEEVFSNTLEIRTRRFGEGDLETITVMGNLALVQEKLGRYREAETRQKKANKLRIEQQGDQHPDVGIGLSNLGHIQSQRGRYSSAMKSLEAAYPLLRETLGPEHDKTLQAANNLATVYSKRNYKEKAMDLRLETLDAQKKVLGSEHPHTLSSMNNLAVLLRDFDRFEESEALQREVLEIETRVLGPDHPTTLTSLENLGGLLFMTGEYDECLEITKSVLEARRRVLGENHPEVAKTTYNMGMLSNSVNDSSGALEYFEAALQIFENTTGLSNFDASNCLMQLGDLKLDAGDYLEAAQHFADSIEARRSLDDNGIEVGYMLHQRAFCLGRAGQRDAAIASCQEALELRRQVLGDRDQATLVTLYSLSRMMLGVERFEESELLASEYYETQLEQLGPDHKLVGQVRKHFVELYEAWGKPEAADFWR